MKSQSLHYVPYLNKINQTYKLGYFLCVYMYKYQSSNNNKKKTLK